MARQDQLSTYTDMVQCMMNDAMQELSNRITEYLCLGGLFNPELMDHMKVRDLLIEIRKVLDENCY